MTKRLVLFGLGAYRRILSPFLPAACRYFPSCSAYAAASVERFGVARGVRLAATRLLRCNARHPGGYDPIPE
jgi:uncharacterized protein